MSVERILAGKGRNVVTVSPDCGLAEAAQTLNQHRIGAAVIVDGDGAVLGIISERDVVRAVAEGGAASLDKPVSSRMTTKVVTCSPSCTVNDLMELMTQGKFRHVPVVEGGRLTGIVSIGDVVKHRVAEIENEQRALKDYIATA